MYDADGNLVNVLGISCDISKDERNYYAEHRYALFYGEFDWSQVDHVEYGMEFHPQE